MGLLDTYWFTGSVRGWCREAEPVGRGAVAPTACEPSAGGSTLQGCPIMMEAVRGTTDEENVHAAAEVRDRDAVAARREAADRAGARARRGSHDDLPLARPDAGRGDRGAGRQAPAARSGCRGADPRARARVGAQDAGAGDPGVALGILGCLLYTSDAAD